MPLRAAVAVGALLTALVAGGCASSVEVEATAEPAEEASTAAPESDAAGIDEDSCAGFVDVMTILHNVDAAVHDGRMDDHERKGWYALASRVLDRAPASGEGPISDALTALQEAVPAVSFDSGGIVDMQSDAANTAGAALREACDAGGYETGAAGFVGG